MLESIDGFSKLSKLEKIDFLIERYFNHSYKIREELKSFWHRKAESQKIFDELSENTITNFYFPFGIVPGVTINQKTYCVPMAIEESSVVAASCKSAKYWSSRGGFHGEVLSTHKVGQVHFFWFGAPEKLFSFFHQIKGDLLKKIYPLEERMKERGGGLLDLSLVDKTGQERGYFQLMAKFETCDTMGANFINTILEALAKSFKEKVSANANNLFVGSEKDITIILSILSNYTPECLVRSYIECPVEALADESFEMGALEFAEKFTKAVRISKVDPYRATTHNKGIFNGIDAVAIATGNDFRAVEAAGHAYAARDGHYRGLTHIDDEALEEGIFKYEIKIPLALGTIGGLTSLHPLARFSLDLLGRPGARKLMIIVATMGLAQNFAALRSLITTGIQKGHMKMHLLNVLKRLEATKDEKKLAKDYFKDKTVSHHGVRQFLMRTRSYQ